MTGAAAEHGYVLHKHDRCICRIIGSATFQNGCIMGVTAIWKTAISAAPILTR